MNNKGPPSSGRATCNQVLDRKPPWRAKPQDTAASLSLQGTPDRFFSSKASLTVVSSENTSTAGSSKSLQPDNFSVSRLTSKSPTRRTAETPSDFESIKSSDENYCDREGCKNIIDKFLKADKTYGAEAMVTRPSNEFNLDKHSLKKNAKQPGLSKSSDYIVAQSESESSSLPYTETDDTIKRGFVFPGGSCSFLFRDESSGPSLYRVVNHFLKDKSDPSKDDLQTVTNSKDERAYRWPTVRSSTSRLSDDGSLETKELISTTKTPSSLTKWKHNKLLSDKSKRLHVASDHNDIQDILTRSRVHTPAVTHKSHQSLEDAFDELMWFTPPSLSLPRDRGV